MKSGLRTSSEQPTDAKSSLASTAPKTGDNCRDSTNGSLQAKPPPAPMDAGSAASLPGLRGSEHSRTDSSGGPSKDGTRTLSNLLAETGQRHRGTPLSGKQHQPPSSSECHSFALRGGLGKPAGAAAPRRCCSTTPATRRQCDMLAKVDFNMAVSSGTWKRF